MKPSLSSALPLSCPAPCSYMPQLFWMMFSLYGLPLLFDYYHIRSAPEYYSDECLHQLQPQAYPNGTAQLFCNWMNRCGLPFGEANTGALGRLGTMPLGDFCLMLRGAG